MPNIAEIIFPKTSQKGTESIPELMTLYQNTVNELGNRQKSAFFPFFGTDARGNIEGPRKWGAVGTLRYHYANFAKLPTTPHLLLHTHFFLLFCHVILSGLLECCGKWGPL